MFSNTLLKAVARIVLTPDLLAQNIVEMVTSLYSDGGTTANGGVSSQVVRFDPLDQIAVSSLARQVRTQSGIYTLGTHSMVGAAPPGPRIRFRSKSVGGLATLSVSIDHSQGITASCLCCEGSAMLSRRRRCVSFTYCRQLRRLKNEAGDTITRSKVHPWLSFPGTRHRVINIWKELAWTRHLRFSKGMKILHTSDTDASRESWNDGTTATEHTTISYPQSTYTASRAASAGATVKGGMARSILRLPIGVPIGNDADAAVKARTAAINQQLLQEKKKLLERQQAALKPLKAKAEADISALESCVSDLRKAIFYQQHSTLSTSTDRSPATWTQKVELLRKVEEHQLSRQELRRIMEPGELRVFVRCCPIPTHAELLHRPEIKIGNEDHTLGFGMQDFQFSSVFASNTEKAFIFEQLESLIRSAIFGETATIIVDGTAAQARLDTFVGGSNSIVPQALRRIMVLGEVGILQVECSVVEIYNEEGWDLLAYLDRLTPHKVSIARDDGSIQDIRRSIVHDYEDIVKITACVQRRRRKQKSSINPPSHVVVHCRVLGDKELDARSTDGNLYLVYVGGRYVDSRANNSISTGASDSVQQGRHALHRVLCAHRAGQLPPFQDSKVRGLSKEDKRSMLSKIAHMCSVDPNPEQCNQSASKNCVITLPS